MFQSRRLSPFNHTLPSTCQISPPPPEDSTQNRGLFLHPLGALPSPAGAHPRGVAGARLAGLRAPRLCSRAEPEQLRHGGGPSAGLALVPSSFLEFRADSRRTHFLSEVNMTRARGCAEPRRSLSRRILSLCLFPTSLFTFPPFSSTNSEEAKSTTWLHPVTGEAVVTGHRKTPGTHAHAECTGRLSARHGGGKKWSISRGEEGEFFPAAEQQPPPVAPPLCLPRADHLRPPPLEFSTWTLCDTVFKSSVT